MKYLKDEEAAKDAVQQVFLKVITELQKYPVDDLKAGCTLSEIIA
jgi:RNA polymerase sigma-70 factor (ECF subfamily)